MPSIPLQGGNGEVWPFRWWHFSPQPNCLTAGLKKPQCSRERDSPVGIQNGLGLLPSHKFLFGWNMAILGSIPIYTYTITRKSCKYTTLRGRNIHKSRLKFLHEFAGGHHASVHGKWKTTYLKTKEPWRALIWFWSQATLKVPSVFRHLNSWIFKNHLGDDFPLQADGEIPDPHFFFEASTLGAEPQKITEEFLMKCLDAKKAEQLVKAYQERLQPLSPWFSHLRVKEHWAEYQ